MVSCADENTESQNNATDKTYIIYDTDIGSSTDDLFALGIIYYFANQSDYELIGGTARFGLLGKLYLYKVRR